MDIYVGNLAYQVSDSDLMDAFSKFGQVASAKVIMDKFTGKSKGFGFVTMPSRDEATDAINALNETALSGRPIRVNEARPREDHGGGGGGGGRRDPF